MHELEPKSDDGELSGLCETTAQMHFGGLSPAQRVRFHQVNSPTAPLYLSVGMKNSIDTLTERVNARRLRKCGLFSYRS